MKSQEIKEKIEKLMTEIKESGIMVYVQFDDCAQRFEELRLIQLEEDWVDVGEGWEPVSAYAQDKDIDLSSEPKISKGTLYLHSTTKVIKQGKKNGLKYH